VKCSNSAGVKFSSH